MAKRKKEGTDTEKCPNCSRDRLQRKSAGIWKCKSCGKKVTGGAFKSDTGALDRIEKTLGKEFEELEEEFEEVEEAKQKLEE